MESGQLESLPKKERNRVVPKSDHDEELQLTTVSPNTEYANEY